LQRYFPRQMRERFPEAIAEHRLRREIVATQLANAIINRGGPTIVERIAARASAGVAAIAGAYALARDCFGLVDVNTAIDRLDAKIPGKLQLALYAASQDAMILALTWFARRVSAGADLSPIAARYTKGLADIRADLETLLGPADAAQRQRRIAAHVDAGVPADLARAIADLDALAAAPDAILVAETLKRPVREVAAAHYALGRRFRFQALVAQGRAVPVADDYERLARDRAVDAIQDAHRRATTAALGERGGGAAAAEVWLAAHEARARRIEAEIEAIAASGLSLAKLVVAASLAGELAAP
jgi:glutamate dehydrogenase